MNAAPALDSIRPASSRAPGHVQRAELQRAEHLIIRVNDLLYAIPLDAFEQVAVGTFREEAVPDLSAWRGTAQWNGTTLPALDLHRLLDPDCRLAPTPLSTSSRLVIFPVATFRCALLVDACVGSFGLSRVEGLHLNRTRLLSEPLAGYGEIFQWRDDLVVRIRPADLLRPQVLPRLRARLAQVDPRIALSAEGRVQAARLQQEELSLELDWSSELCRDLARQYQDLGLTPDAERLERLALQRTGLSSSHISERRIEGELPGHGLVQALQVIGLRRLSGELFIQSGEHGAHLYFDVGRPIRATSKAQAGNAVLDEAARWPNGSYRFTEQSVRNLTGNLEGSPETAGWIQRLLQSASSPQSTASPNA